MMRLIWSVLLMEMIAHATQVYEILMKESKLSVNMMIRMKSNAACYQMINRRIRMWKYVSFIEMMSCEFGNSACPTTFQCLYWMFNTTCFNTCMYVARELIGKMTRKLGNAAYPVRDINRLANFKITEVPRKLRRGDIICCFTFTDSGTSRSEIPICVGIRFMKKLFSEIIYLDGQREQAFFRLVLCLRDPEFIGQYRTPGINGVKRCIRIEHIFHD